MRFTPLLEVCARNANARRVCDLRHCKMRPNRETEHTRDEAGATLVVIRSVRYLFGSGDTELTNIGPQGKRVNHKEKKTKLGRVFTHPSLNGWPRMERAVPPNTRQTDMSEINIQSTTHWKSVAATNKTCRSARAPY